MFVVKICRKKKKTPKTLTSSFVDLLIGLETLLGGQPKFRKFSCESHRDDAKF